MKGKQFDEKEVKSILTMLNSKDRGDATLALEILNTDKKVDKRYKRKMLFGVKNAKQVTTGRGNDLDENDLAIIIKSLELVEKVYKLKKFEADIQRRQRNSKKKKYAKKK